MGRVFSKYSRASDGSLYYEGELVTVNEQPRFSDMIGHWAQSAATVVTTHGLMEGKSATTFEPDDMVTCGMAVSVLGQMANISGDAPVISQLSDAYYVPYINWALESGIVSDAAALNFDPNESITREKFAVILENYVQKNNIVLEKKTVDLNKYTDVQTISSWAIQAMQYCVDTGLYSGCGDGNLAPQNELTRAELAVILSRLAIQ